MTRLWSLVGQFGDRAKRSEITDLLARSVGAERMLIFVPDPELGILLPGLGFQQTLNRAWRTFVEQASRDGRATAELPLEQNVWKVRAFQAGECVLALLGEVASAPDDVETLLQLVPLMGALLQNELVAKRAEENAVLAQTSAAEADLLTRTLDQARRELQVRWRQLSEAKSAAESASRAKSDFLANMSHEIRTPMAAILGYVDILQRQLTDPDNLECLAIINRNGMHLLEIINDILDLSKIEAGNLEVEVLPVSISSLVEEVRSLMDVRANEKNLSLEVQFEGLMPETIQSDPTRLRQILMNLIGNALKFTQQGFVRVHLRLLAEEQKLEVCVEDSGMGMEESVLAKLFQPFHQSDSSVTRRFGGTGLGLAISRQLVHVLGGEIEVRSRPNVGSVFTFQVATGSLEGVAMIEPRAVVHRVASHGKGLPTLGGCAVLVVDDRPDIRNLVRSHLESAGANVYVAEDGQSAIDFLQNRRVDAVVLDMQMPVMDGYATARALRAGGSRIPILALTASAMKGDRQDCLAAGCDGYLTKPVDRGALIQQVWNLVQHSRTLRVLIVEDNPMAAKAVQMMLDTLGCESFIAETGRAALEEVSTRDLDVVLLDLGLPDMDGWQILACLRALPVTRTLRVVALTGRRGDEVSKHNSQLTFDQVLEKPATRDTLIRTLFQGGEASRPNPGPS